MPKSLALTLLLLTEAATLGFALTAESSRQMAAGPIAEGVLTPVGGPSQPPVRTDAGGACVVDLEQDYELSGTLSGSATIDYRILVHGPCGSPPGTFREEWIAYGHFVGALSSTETTASFTYVASVAEGGGEVDGKIVLGSKLNGELKVTGRFSDRRLSYTGWARTSS